MQTNPIHEFYLDKLLTASPTRQLRAFAGIESLPIFINPCGTIFSKESLSALMMNNAR
jgi:hypothetical protein